MHDLTATEVRARQRDADDRLNKMLLRHAELMVDPPLQWITDQVATYGTAIYKTSVPEVTPVLSLKAGLLAGAAAAVMRNPVVSRRWWRWTT